mmetsp:Transcript_21076/g.39611  ORF Transcript_21076/g.39611 Transcript_21076/m.39611 type:complete len:368 (-) Transcript_21076:58-1161(-)
MKSLDKDESGEMSPIVREFCAFLVRASGLQSTLEAFMAEHCAEFLNSSVTGEHKLQWTDLHKRYVELAEHQLDQFLREGGLTAEELGERLKTSLGKSMWSLPLLHSLEYQAFALQMIALASAPQLRAEALSSSGLLGGVWKPEKFEPRRIERFLKAQGVPWILRRLHVFATTKEICIVEMPGTVPIFTIWESRYHGFGVRMTEVVADGVERYEGLLQTRAWLQGPELHVVQSPHGMSGVETIYTASSDGISLCVRRELWGATDAFGSSYTQQFMKCKAVDAVQQTDTASLGEDMLNFLSKESEAKAFEPPLPSPSAPVEGACQYPNVSKVPAPLMPCAPAGAPTRQPIARRRFQRPMTSLPAASYSR